MKKATQEPLQTRSVSCKGGLKSPLPLPVLCWPQQQHAKIFKGLLMVLACSYKYSEINTYIPHGQAKVKMLALVEGFLSSFSYPVPMP